MHTFFKFTGLLLMAASLNAYSCLPEEEIAATPAPAPSGPSAPECECDASVDKVLSDPLTPGGQGSYLLYVDYYGDEHCRDGALCVQDVLPAGRPTRASSVRRGPAPAATGSPSTAASQAVCPTTPCR